MDWRDFEKLVLRLFESTGYSCRHVAGKRDHGADIIASRNGSSEAIQVKHRANGWRWIGERAVRDVASAVSVYACTRGVVVTNSTFSPDAEKIAEIHGVTLRDRNWLAIELASYCELCEVRVPPSVRSWCAEHPEYHGKTYCYKHQHDLSGLLRIAEPASA